MLSLSLTDLILQMTSKDTSETLDELKRFNIATNATIDYKNQNYNVNRKICSQRCYYNKNDNKPSQIIDLTRRNKVNFNTLNKQDLQSSTETKGFGLPNVDIPGELQTHGSVQPNKLVDNSETQPREKTLFKKYIVKSKLSKDVKSAVIEKRKIIIRKRIKNGNV